MYILSDMALSLCVSAIFLIFPPIFSVIARFERYEEPKNELYINMFRLANWLICHKNSVMNCCLIQQILSLAIVWP